jgi:hypothetical protein
MSFKADGSAAVLDICGPHPVDTAYRRKMLATLGQEKPMPRFKFVDRKAHPFLYHWQRFVPEQVTTLLRENVIWFSRPDTFNDPWDCKPCFNSDFADNPAEVEKHVASYADITCRPTPDIPEEFIAQRQREFRDNPKLVAGKVDAISQGTWRVVADRYRVYCLGPDSGNLLMWSHYADNHKGIVVNSRVLTNFDEFVKALPTLRSPR